MLSCKESTYLISAARDRPLGIRERFALKLHLLICRGCTNYDRQMDFLRAAMRYEKKPREDRHEDRLPP